MIIGADHKFARNFTRYPDWGANRDCYLHNLNPYSYLERNKCYQAWQANAFFPDETPECRPGMAINILGILICFDYRSTYDSSRTTYL